MKPLLAILALLALTGCGIYSGIKQTTPSLEYPEGREVQEETHEQAN